MRAWLSIVCLLPLGAQAAPGDNSLGVNVHDGAPEFIAAAAALGVRWVRFDGNWNDHEPADEQYQWRLDGAVNAARAANLDVFITLAYTPAWVPRRGDTDGVAANDVPTSAAPWSDFVSDAVTHYRALGVRHFGMWNEANLRQFFEGSTADYVNTIAIPGAAAVRMACADCVVLGPELANVGDVDDVLEEVLRLAPTGTFDIITHHTYNGFTETGWRQFDGDGFINVLDHQRFPFTRRSVRQLLDAAGYTGEVWITETGYRAAPGSAGEEQTQAIYVRRAMEEQLQRAWYTNSFFYEINDCGIDQPSCTIDGFGLMRPTGGAPGARQFPAQFRLKPAFQAIQAFIQANPAIVGTQPPPQCGDGLDNDNDGRIDLADRGCSGPQDDLESDDPARELIEGAQLTGNVTVDGDLSELAGARWITLGPAAWQGIEPLGVDDHVVRAAAGWSASGLYIGVEVTDDVQRNDNSPETLWQGDALQLAFDVGMSGGTGYDAVDDHELNFALTPGGLRSYRFHGPAGATDTFVAAVARTGDVTRYEVFLPPSALPGVQLQPRTMIGFSFLVDDDDGTGRVGWSEWTPGIGVSKEPERFGMIGLIGARAVDGGVGDDAAAPVDGAMMIDPDATTGADGSVTAEAGSEPDDGALDATAGAPDATAGAADGGAAADGSVAVPAPESSCGCTTARAPQLGWALALLLLLRVRRRRTA